MNVFVTGATGVLSTHILTGIEQRTLSRDQESARLEDQRESPRYNL